MGGKRGTADRILDTAERLVQVRGFNAFSYADVATEVGVRKASLHHHFPTKGDLGAALIDRYHAAFFAALAAIETDAARAHDRLVAYVGLYGAVLRRNRMCLCGMLATDAATLPKSMRERIARFFEENESWLARILEAGRRRGELRFEGPAVTLAEVFVSSLEGAMLVSRGSGSSRHFDHVARRILESVRPAAVAGAAGRSRGRGRTVRA
jgi:TetR/AcrR family transcriptional repressor of nem operon